jgi:hypothetical protein
MKQSGNNSNEVHNIAGWVFISPSVTIIQSCHDTASLGRPPGSSSTLSMSLLRSCLLHNHNERSNVIVLAPMLALYLGELMSKTPSMRNLGQTDIIPHLHSMLTYAAPAVGTLSSTFVGCSPARTILSPSLLLKTSPLASIWFRFQISTSQPPRITPTLIVESRL